MSDYIKREDAMAEFATNGSATVYGIDKCKAIISRLQLVPSADVVERSSYESMEHTVAKLNEALSNSVEVVRCKDCKHYKRNIPCVGGHYNGCDEWIDEGNAITVYDNDYCSYGERA